MWKVQPTLPFVKNVALGAIVIIVGTTWMKTYGYISSCGANTLSSSNANNVYKISINQEHYEDHSMRLCEQNPFAKSFNMSLETYGEALDTWIKNKVEIEKALVEKGRDHSHTHMRFEAFEVMGACNEVDCIGGACGRDVSKTACGVKDTLEEPCVVYSIGGNNQWEFELDVLAKTPCEVHTFDCTGNITRFQVPENPRLHFHHICLGTENKENDTGEFWTLNKMTDTLNHKQIDLLKVDIEGYEFPLFQSWPNREHKTYERTVLPMQVLVEVHYQTQMPELSNWHRGDWKYVTDMVNLQEHLLKMGYATIFRDDNRFCPHCSELTLVRVRCPPEPTAAS